MKERIKLFSIGMKKMKANEVKDWNELIEEYAPGMYDTINVVGEEESIKQIAKLRPEIILLSDKIKDGISLLMKIKQIHPQVVIFIFLSMVGEQEVIDKYMAHGVYKCYEPPIVMDTLVHDMYVALNME